jgi:hypothetical protein
MWLLLKRRNKTFGFIRKGVIYMRNIYKLNIQNEWERKGDRRCKGCNTVMSSILPFQIVFAFTETSDPTEFSRRRRGEGHFADVGAGGGVL